MIVSLSHAVIRENQSSLFLKKNPNLAKIFSFTLCYQLEISLQFFTAYIPVKRSKMRENW